MTKEELDQTYRDLDIAISSGDYGKAGDCATAILEHCVINKEAINEETRRHIQALLSGQAQLLEDQRLDHIITYEFLRLDGYESATEFMIEKARKIFKMVNKEIICNLDPPITIAEWLFQQVPIHPYAFAPSRKRKKN